MLEIVCQIPKRRSHGHLTLLDGGLSVAYCRTTAGDSYLVLFWSFLHCRGSLKIRPGPNQSADLLPPAESECSDFPGDLPHSWVGPRLEIHDVLLKLFSGT